MKRTAKVLPTIKMPRFFAFYEAVGVMLFMRALTWLGVGAMKSFVAGAVVLFLFNLWYVLSGVLNKETPVWTPKKRRMFFVYGAYFGILAILFLIFKAELAMVGIVVVLASLFLFAWYRISRLNR